MNLDPYHADTLTADALAAFVDRYEIEVAYHIGTGTSVYYWPGIGRYLVYDGEAAVRYDGGRADKAAKTYTELVAKTYSNG